MQRDGKVGTSASPGAEGGPYRAATNVIDGLPLPRRCLETAAIFVAAVTGAAWTLPLAFLDQTGALPRSLARSSVGMWGLVAVHVVLLPFVGVRSVGLAHGRRLEGASRLLALSLAPLIIAALVDVVETRGVVASMEPEVGRDAGQILAQRLGALAPLTGFASLATASALAVVATGAVSAFATVDHGRVHACRGPVITTLLASASWLVASTALGGHASVAARLGVVALAVLVARGAPSVRHAGGAREAVDLLRCALVAAVAAAVIVVLEQRAIASLEDAALAVPSGDADPDGSARLVALAAARSAHVRSTIVDAAGAAACFLIPLGSILRGARTMGARSVITSLALVGAFAATLGVVAIHRVVEDRVGAELAGRNQLALLRRVWRARPGAPRTGAYETRAPILAIAADGTTLGRSADADLVASEPSTRFDVFVDTLLRQARPGCGSDGPHPLHSFRLIAPTASLPELGPTLDAFQAPPTTAYAVALWEHDEDDLGVGGLGFLSTGLPSARIHQHALLGMPRTAHLADGDDGFARRRDMGEVYALASCLSALRLVPRPDDSMQRVLDAVAALARDARERGCVPKIELVRRNNATRLQPGD